MIFKYIRGFYLPPPPRRWEKMTKKSMIFNFKPIYVIKDTWGWMWNFLRIFRLLIRRLPCIAVLTGRNYLKRLYIQKFWENFDWLGKNFAIWTQLVLFDEILNFVVIIENTILQIIRLSESKYNNSAKCR